VAASAFVARTGRLGDTLAASVSRQVSPARATMPPITEALGRGVRLKAPAERIVVGFNFEEFKAVS
jgi:hypothetical protein